MISSQLHTNSPLLCPCCSKLLDGITGDVSIAVHGDFSVCSYCCTILVFQGRGMNLTMRKMTTSEMKKLKKSDRKLWDLIQHYIYLIKET